MATLNVSVTQSNVLLTTAVSSGSTLDFVIDNPIPYTSYFTLETVADNNGFYTNSTSKNTSGSFTLGTGQFGLIQSDYMASVVVPSGSTTLRFIPAVNIPASTLYLRGIGAGPYSTIATYLLDTYSGAAAAYSVRLLSSTYAGSAIRVRRSSDNTEQNIGFDSNGNLDTASLLSFCGAGDGFVTTWYDQSGNNYHVTQSSAINQPQIVNAGSLLLKNGKPSIVFDGTGDFLASANITNTFINSSIFSVVSITPNGTEDIPFGYGLTGQASRIRCLYVNPGGKLSFAGWGNDYISTIDALSSDLYLFSTVQNGSNITLRKNTTTNTGTTSGGSLLTTTTAVYNIGSLNGAIVGNYYTAMTGSEFIFFQSDQSANQAGIESNINTYYAIY